MKKLLRLFMLAALFLPLALQAQTQNLTVCDGTANSQKIPFDGYNADHAQHNQMLYPATDLTAMNGQAIMQMVFYIDQSASNGSNTAASRLGTWTVSLGETTATSLSDLDNTTTLTQVYQGYFDCSTGTLTLEFDQAYMYNGGNLLVDLNHAAASWNRWYFLGVTTTADAAYNSDDDNSYTFLPKCTFTYGAAPTCFKVTNLSASNATSSSLTLSWTDALNTGATYSIYDMSDTSLIQAGVSGLTYTVTDLTANTLYNFGVMTDCGGGDVTDYALVSGRTACAAIAELPYTMGFEDADLQGTTSALLFPYCWTRINTLASGTYTYYPYSYTSSYSTVSHGDSRALYFYASSYGTYADTTGFIMPELDINTYPMNANRVTFWAKVTSTTAYSVQVGTMSDPNDLETFTLIETVTVTGTDYTKYTVSLAEANYNDAYVAFIVPKVSATMYIDDVTLEEAPSCLEVPSVTITETTSSTITLNWTENPGNASATYTVYEVTPDGNVEIESNIADTTYTVEDLEPNTQYTFAVQANCTSGDAPLTTVSGRTACTTFEITPDNLFSEGFEGTEFPPACWSKAHTAGTSTNTWIRNTTASNVHTGSASAQLQDQQSGNKNDLVTPLLNIPEANAYQVSFWINRTTAYASKTQEGVKVWVNTTPDTIGGTPLMHIRRSTTQGDITVDAAGWYQYSAAIPTSGDVYIIFEGISEYGAATYIDDISIEEAPECLPVTNLAVSGITAHGATLTWEGDADSYVIYNMADTSVYDNASSTEYTFEGLDPMTSYTFGVASSCGNDESSIVTKSFTTLVSCFAPSNVAVALTPGDGSVATVSWTDTLGAAWQLCLNGDTTDLYDADETSYTFTGLTPEQPYTVMVRTNCSADGEGFSAWTSVVNFTPTDAYSITVNEGTTTNSYVPIYGSWVDNITKSQFIIPATDLTAMQFGNINKLTFYASTASAPWNGASFNVYLTETNETTVETLADYDGMTQVYAGSLSIVDNKMVVNFTTPYTYMGGNLMIGFLQTVSGAYTGCNWYGVTATGASQGGYGTSVSQRNFLPKTTINYAPGEEPDCLPVTGLAVVDSTITTEGATLTWNGDADSYNVYVINGTDTTFEQNVTETTATLTGLTAMTSYTYGVRAVCGTNESDIRTVNFATACAAVELPYTETFEATSNTRDCWNLVSNNTANVGGTNGMGFVTVDNREVLRFSSYSNASDYNQYGFSPLMEVSSDAANLRVSVVYGTRANDYLYFGYVTATDTVWDPTPYNTNSSSSTYNWQTYTNVIPATATHIAVRYYGNFAYYAWIDSVTVTELTEDFCFAPTGLAASNITTDGATLTWNGEADSYNVFVITPTDTTLVENVTDNTITLDGLTAMTSYTYGVTSVCTNGESDIRTVTFTTACAAVAIPYTESFEATSTTLGCWSVANIDANTGITTSNPYSGNNAFIFSYNTNPPQYLISPELSGTEDGLQVSFMYRIQSTSYPESFQLGYSTTTNEISAFTWGVEQTNLMNTTYEEYSEILPAGVKYVCIKYTANDMFYLYIDDVTFATPPTCLPVTNLTVDSTTESSVFLSWTDNNNTDITYTVYNGDNVVATNIANTNYEVTGLSASNNYTFGVVANCSATDASDMVTINATTECGDVTALPYNEGFENGLGCWTTINGSSDGQPWNAQGASSDGTITPHTGNGMAASWSWNDVAMHANAWLISPKFVLPNTTENLTFTWWERTNSGYPDHYSVVLSTTTNDTAAFTTVVYPNNTAAGEWTQKNIDLSAYAGQNIYIAFHHVDYDMNYLLIDDIELSQGGYVPPTPDTLTVTFAVNDATMGTTVPAPGTYQYVSGDTIFFKAVRNTGYHYVGWELMLGSTVADTFGLQYLSAYMPADALMQYGNITLTALFEVGNPDSTTVTYAVNDPTMGTITPAPGTYTIYVGDAIDATATPNTGYQLSAWMFDIYLGTTLYSSDTIFSTGANFSNPMQFGTLPQNFADYNATITITALFEADSTPVVTTYTVTLSTADATMGTVNLPGENTVVANNQFTAQATANEGYHFVAWTSNNATVSTANPYTFTVTADIALTATFEADSTPVVVCNTPTGLHYTAIENHAIAIAWDADANVNSWNIRYRMSGNGAWNNATSNTNSYTISGLQGLTSYDIEVQANCGDGNVSEWCDAITVQTTNVGIVNHLENSVVLFPNPAREYVDIRIDGEFNVSSMEVYDVYGKLINNINVVDNPTRIYVSNLSNGMYFVRVTTDAGVVTKTFVKK